MKRNLKHTLEIAETASDPRTKLQARDIANDTLKMIDERIEKLEEEKGEEATASGVF
jgi:hypothetical protein